MGSHSAGSDDDWLTVESSFHDDPDAKVHTRDDHDDGDATDRAVLIRKRKDSSKKKSKKKDKRDHKRLRREQSQKQDRSGIDKLRFCHQMHAKSKLHRDSSPVFSVETLGDDENLFYGTLSKKDTPMYYLEEKNNVRENVRIVRYYDKQTTEAVVSLDDECYFDRRNSPEHESDLVSFIPLYSRSALSLKNGSANMGDDLKQKKAMFDNHLQQNPSDIGTWIDYICFQSKNFGSDVRRAERNRSVSLISAQNFHAKKALENNKDSKILKRLSLQLDLCLSEIENKDSTGSCGKESLQRRIEELLDSDSSSDYLWLRLIQCQQQNFSNFTLSAIRDTFARLIATYRTKTSQVTSTKSLQTDTIDAGCITNKLVYFHRLYCAFERKTGYTERAIANAKTLMDYNIYLSNRRKHHPAKSNGSHLELWRKFQSTYWTSDKLPVLEGDCPKARPEDLDLRFYSFPFSCTSPHTFSRALSDHVDRQWSTLTAGMIPHTAVLTEKHEQSLLGTSLCHSHHKMGLTMCEESSKHTSDRVPISDEEQIVYSNLHGYRIQLGKVNDGAEYRSILHDLRNGVGSAKGQQSTERKQRRAQLHKENLLDRVRDERIDYSDAFKNLEEDIYFDWLHEESVRSICDWIPLNPNHADHQTLLSEQPERAVLSEETQPFVFAVIDDQRINLITNLLEQCGVKDKSLERSAVYIDDFEELELLAQPLLSILTQNETNKDSSCLELPLAKRITLLQDNLLSTIVISDSTVLYDYMKQEFVRSTLKSSLDKGTEYSRFTYMKLLMMYIEFEARIARVVQEDKNWCKDKVTTFIQEQQARCVQIMSKYDLLLSSTPKNSDNAHDAEVVGIIAFATYATSVGNIKKANKLCDRSLASIRERTGQSSSYPRNFHYLIFLRSRNELWEALQRSHTAEELAKSHLRTLYILGFGLINAPPFLQSLEKVSTKKGNRLVQYLESLFDDPVTSLIINSYRSELDSALRSCTKHHSGVTKCRWWGRCCSVGQTLHNLCLAVYCADGFGRAKLEYENFIDSDKTSADINLCCHHEWITLSYLEFLSRHQASQASPTLTPHAWSEAVTNAAINYPKDLYLRLLADTVGGRSLVVSRHLRRFFTSIYQRAERQLSSLQISEWLFCLLCEIMRLERIVKVQNHPLESIVQREITDTFETCCLWHRWKCNRAGVDRVRNLFEQMVECSQSQQCALLWRLYLRFEVAMGKIGAAKKVFYRGLSVCPWSRALYLDGFTVCRPYFSKRECDDLLHWMVTGGLNIRDELE
uniref:Uncharacterized protein AlNc14C8G1012 n=1 Tax=Albugo laibachii Nc14 TaxID=890382 RepID=F0W1T2_9STRA|nr:hypothetical protein PITG_00210 [Albugo laibachii Nc14]|eukprot:CCA15011.1 hypothetical protein PITG_00210 [Albugo laibachii Nc14]